MDPSQGLPSGCLGCSSLPEPPPTLCRVQMQNGQEVMVSNPSTLPPADRRRSIEEPYVR